jgi:hypothetical protein
MAPSSREPTCHSMLTKRPARSHFLTSSPVSVRPPEEPGNDIPASRFAGSAPDAYGLQAERRKRRSSNNCVASWTTTSTFCACIQCRTRRTIKRWSACALSTPLCLPASSVGGASYELSSGGDPIAVRGDRGIFRRRDRLEESRRGDFIVERRCSADVRVHGAGGHRPPDHDDHSSRAARGGTQHPETPPGW